MITFNDIYEKTYKTMGELQPIAFLLSASIVISGIYARNENIDLSSRIYTLSAAGCFFFAYLYFLSFRLTNFKLFFVPGIASLMAAFYFIFRSVIGILVIATNLNEEYVANGYSSDLESILTVMVILFVVILTFYSINCIKKSEFYGYKRINKVIKICYYLLYVIISTLIIIRCSSPFAACVVGILGVDIFVLSTLFAHNSLATALRAAAVKISIYKDSDRMN